MAIKKEQVKKAAASYTTEQEQERQPVKEKKTAISFYVRPSVYEDIKRLAHYRGISAGTLIDDTLAAYLEDHRDELTAYDEFTAKMQAKKK